MNFPPSAPRVRNRRTLPLASYDPRLKALLLKAVHERVEIGFESKGEATKMRQTLHTYRSTARSHFGPTAPEEWEPLYRTLVRLEQRGKLWFVVAMPRESEFSDKLDALGIQPAELKEGGDAFLERLQKELKDE
jgi:hypothetical protein